MVFLGASEIKNSPGKTEDVRVIPESEDPLEKEMATYSSILAWEISWMEEPGGLYSPSGQKGVEPDLAAKQHN